MLGAKISRSREDDSHVESDTVSLNSVISCQVPNIKLTLTCFTPLPTVTVIKTIQLRKKLKAAQEPELSSLQWNSVLCSL